MRLADYTSKHSTDDSFSAGPVSTLECLLCYGFLLALFLCKIPMFMDEAVSPVM